MPRQPTPNPTPTRANQAFQTIDPTWILKALGITFAIALAFAYVTLCTVFWFHQWQIVLHPSREVPATPAALNLPFTEVHFAAANSGEPQLDGWWIPSEENSLTALILHDGDGSLSNTLPILHDLHNARLNVLVFDYRGYGHSAGQHPTQSLMEEDAANALTYLTTTRNIPASSIIIYGTGVGASLAVKLCADHKDIPALILESPTGDLAQTAASDIRSHIIPTHLLFHEDFPLASPLASLPTPKLLITYAIPNAPTPPSIRNAADPKTTVELPISPTASIAIHAALLRFLDSYLTRPPATLTPQH